MQLDCGGAASGRRDMNKNIVFLVAVILLSLMILGCGDDPTSVADQRFSTSVENSFAVGKFSTLAVDNFVGNVTVRPGAAGVIIIIATKWAEHRDDLAKISIDMAFDADDVYIATDDPSDVDGGAVDFEVTVPPDAQVTVHNGVGNTNYTGQAAGTNIFETGVGGIRLNLPSNINVEIELSVGVGSIYLDFPVNGQISQRAVSGIIGTGIDGIIYAEVGVGNLRLNRQ